MHLIHVRVYAYVYVCVLCKFKRVDLLNYVCVYVCVLCNFKRVDLLNYV